MFYCLRNQIKLIADCLICVVKAFVSTCLLQAECCKDHVHCCQAGTLCYADRSSCVNTSVSVPWVERTSARQPQVYKVRLQSLVYFVNAAEMF